MAGWLTGLLCEATCLRARIYVLPPPRNQVEKVRNHHTGPTSASGKNDNNDPNYFRLRMTSRLTVLVCLVLCLLASASSADRTTGWPRQLQPIYLKVYQLGTLPRLAGAGWRRAITTKISQVDCQTPVSQQRRGRKASCDSKSETLCSRFNRIEFWLVNLQIAVAAVCARCGGVSCCDCSINWKLNQLSTW